MYISTNIYIFQEEIWIVESPGTLYERDSKHKKTGELDERELRLKGIDTPNGQICLISKAVELVGSGGALVQTLGKALLYKQVYF